MPRSENRQGLPASLKPAVRMHCGVSMHMCSACVHVHVQVPVPVPVHVHVRGHVRVHVKYNEGQCAQKAKPWTLDAYLGPKQATQQRERLLPLHHLCLQRICVLAQHATCTLQGVGVC